MDVVMNFAIVLGVAVAIAGGIGTLYATGLRLWMGSSAKAEGGTSVGARIGAVICFALCVVIVLYALWLMIPLFH